MQKTLEEESNTLCNWCGIVLYQENEYTSELSCGSRTCGRKTYHTACVEDHLKRQGFEKTKLLGFPCPHGCSPRYQLGEPCRGKIEKTHPKIPCKNKKNKKKNAVASAQAPKATSKPKVTLTAAAVAVAASVTANLAKHPVPVRRSQVPGTSGTVVSAPPTKSDYARIASELRRDMGLQDVFDTSAAGPDSFLSNKFAALSAAAPLGAVAPLNKNKTKFSVEGSVEGSDEEWIPDTVFMELKRKGRRAKFAPEPHIGTKQPAKQSFNLFDESDSFPALQTGCGSNSLNAASAANKIPKGSKSINAMDPSHAGGFVRDINRYNAILEQLGVMDSISDDDEDDSINEDKIEWTAPQGGTSSLNESFGPPDENRSLLEEQLTQVLGYALDEGIEYGLRQVGLNVSEYLPTVEQILTLISEDVLQSLRHKPQQLPADQQAEKDKAAYLAAEQIVLLDEQRAKDEQFLQSRYQASIAAVGPYVDPAPLFVAPQKKPTTTGLLQATPDPPFFGRHPFTAGCKSLALHGALQDSHDDVDVDELLALCLG